MTNTAVATTEAVIPAPEGQGCPKCGGFVYHADQVFSKDRVYHKQCFKCTVCKKQLDSRLANDGPDNDIYCSGCYRKNFSLKGYGFGQGGPALMCADSNGVQSSGQAPATSKSMDTAAIPAAPGEGCPRCHGQVFHAEQMFSKGKVYHKKCFTCANCKRPLDSVLCCDGGGDIFCKGCYAKIFGAKGYGFGCGAAFLQCSDLDGQDRTEKPHLVFDTAAIRGKTGDKDTCPRCGGAVFHAEKMPSKKAAFHKSCFNCLDCKRPLDSTQCCDAPDGEIFCKLCYGKHYGPKGYGFGGSGSVPALLAPNLHGIAQEVENRERVLTEFMPSGQGDADRKLGCGRCNFEVFEAEKLVAANRLWHKRCFTCAKCNRHLDSYTVNDGPDAEIYCKACYSAKFGVRTYGGIKDQGSEN